MAATTYLSVPETRRKLLVHEKARYGLNGAVPLVWIKGVIADVVDDETLAFEQPVVRLFAIQFEHLAARSGWQIALDERRLAGVLHLRARDVRQAVSRLLELGRLELVSGDRLDDGSVQQALSLFPQASTGTPPSPQRPGSGPVVVPQSQELDEVPSADLAQTNGAAATLASTALAQNRAEQRREELQTMQRVEAEGPVLSSKGQSENQILGRLIGLAARQDPRSAAVIRVAAEGLPDSALATTLESLMGRRPRPRNPAGYVVATLKHYRAHHGLEPLAHVEREPEL